MTNKKQHMFQNTTNVLEDCLETLNKMRERELDFEEELGTEEYQSFIRLLQLAEDLYSYC